MRCPLLNLAVTCLGLAGVSTMARAESISEARLERLFRPLVGELTALSTDGRYLAYTQQVKSDLTIVVYDLERMRKSARIIADSDRPIPQLRGIQHARLRFLKWANGTRLVFAPEVERVESAVLGPSADFVGLAASAGVALPKFTPRPAISAPVLAIDADGGRPRELFDAKDLAAAFPDGELTSRIPTILGFDTGEFRDQLLVELASGGAGRPTRLLRANIVTGALKVVHEVMGPGRFFFDSRGQPLLNQLFDPDGSRPWFFRAAGSKRWEKLTEPPGSAVSFTSTPEAYFGPRAIPLGFDFAPDILIYAANAGRDTFGIYGMNLRTGERTRLAVEHPLRDLAPLDASMGSSTLVFDRFRQHFVGVRAAPASRPLTIWLDPELGAVQRAIEQRFPDRNLMLSDWNEARTRFIVRANGGTEPGSTFLLRRPQGSMTELMRAAPWLEPSDLHETHYVEFPGPGGAQLSGYLTLPRAPRINPPPLILWFASGLPRTGLGCTTSGLSRSSLNALILPTRVNGHTPPVRTVCLKRAGCIRGIRLIHRQSLLDYLDAAGPVPTQPSKNGGRS